MLLLALDTSGATVTAALHDGTSLLAERGVDGRPAARRAARPDARRGARRRRPGPARADRDRGRASDRGRSPGCGSGSVTGRGPRTRARASPCTGSVRSTGSPEEATDDRGVPAWRPTPAAVRCTGRATRRTPVPPASRGRSARSVVPVDLPRGRTAGRGRARRPALPGRAGSRGPSRSTSRAGDAGLGRRRAPWPRAARTVPACSRRPAAVPASPGRTPPGERKRVLR